MVDDVTEWLLDSDPALRWQVERDVLHLPGDVWQATRARVASEGFGAELLARQDADGQWAGGAFFPAGFDFDTIGTVGQPWTATTWTLNSLREWGLDPAALGDTAERLAANSRWEYDDLPYWGGEVDCCINSWTLSNGLWLGGPTAQWVDGIVDWFLQHRMTDGGWNCQWCESDTTVSSFHSTLNSLKGLLDYELATGDAARVADHRHSGEEYLLSRHLMNRRSTGELVGEFATYLGHPWRWRYNVLNALDHFRAAGVRDERMADAVDVVRAARRPDGTWLQQGRVPGAEWVEIDVAPGEPSKWVTFYATRVLAWWDASTPVV